MKHEHPPGFLLRFFRWFCDPLLADYIEGDLIELYRQRLLEKSKRRVDVLLAIDVILLFRPGIIKNNLFNIQTNNGMMIKNYTTVALRNIFKNKAFSVINVSGLAIGLAACMLIFQFVLFELSYDRFHSEADRIYRVTNDRFQHGKLIQHGTITYPTIGPAMAKDYPEIETFTRMMPSGPMNVKVGDKNFRGDQCSFVDENFLHVFDFEILSGDRNTMLKDPYRVVLTESVASKYFEITSQNFSDAIGKIFYWGLDPQPYTVEGVIKNIPENSHLQLDALISYSTLYAGENKDADISWTWSDMRHYLVLKPGIDYKILESKFDDFSERYFQGDKVSGSVEKFHLQPLLETHLYSDYEYDIAKVANGKFTWSLLGAAILILVIAWVNYVNLTTSRSIDRAKEVGVRKVMGAYKSQLVKQFVFESLIVTIVACAIGVGLVKLFQPSFNELMGSTLSFEVLLNAIDSDNIWIIIGLFVGGAVFSGYYPAMILASFEPAITLKGKFSRSFKEGSLRRSLVIFQFTASMILLASAVIISRQLYFMSNADLGVAIDNTVVVQPPELMAWDSTFIQRVESYKEALAQVPGVINASTSTRTPGSRLGRAFGIRLSDQPADAKYTMSHVNVDYNFFDTYQVKFLAGRKFLPTDHHVDWTKVSAVVLNRNAVNLLGIKDPSEAIGRQIVWGNNGTRLWTIVGVIEDFHQESLKKPKEPMIFRPAYSTYSATSIRISSDGFQAALTNIEKIYKQFFPGNSFQYFILDEFYKRQYADDKRFENMIRIFTSLALVVSCLGLLGLALYTASQRTKEIGVRKVLGASVGDILITLFKDLLRPIIYAFIIATPIAWFAMTYWLEDFVYRISINGIEFILAGTLIAFVGVVTVFYQTWRAARMNPVKNLRAE